MEQSRPSRRCQRMMHRMTSVRFFNFSSSGATMDNKLTPEKILQTGMAFWPAKTLLCAVELGVFTELAQGPKSLDLLREQIGLHPRAARDFLDALVALGFLNREGDLYSNTPDTDLFLDR